jgi:hypothetical protein
MVVGFTKSKEGEAEYKKIGIHYPDSLDDEGYEEWLKETSAEQLKEYSNHKEKEVSQISRHRVGEEEYITYSMSHYRLDKALNLTHRWLPNIGIYPIPRARFSVTYGDFGKQTRKFEEVIAIDRGYSIPFSKKNMDKIKNIGLPLNGRGSFAVVTKNGLPITVNSFEDLRDGDFDELAHFGKIPTELQRKRWIDEKGIEQDQELHAEALRRRELGNVPQQSVTADQVRDIIKQEKTSK